MYLLVMVKDEEKLSDAITALMGAGLTQFMTSEKMSDICPDCQNRREDDETKPFNAANLLSDEPGNDELCTEPVFKTEEPDGTAGVPAEDLFADKGEEEDVKPGCLDMLPSTSGNLDHDPYLSNTQPTSKRKLTIEHEDDDNFGALNNPNQKCVMLNGHLMRLHRLNQDRTAYYYCYYRNRASSLCPGTYRFNQVINRVTVITEHNHAPNPELDRSEMMKFQLKEVNKNKEAVERSLKEAAAERKKAQRELRHRKKVKMMGGDI